MIGARGKTAGLNQPKLPAGCDTFIMALSQAELERLTMPVMENPNCYDVVVVGGPAGKDLVLRTLAPPATVEIREP